MPTILQSGGSSIWKRGRRAEGACIYTHTCMYKYVYIYIYMTKGWPGRSCDLCPILRWAVDRTGMRPRLAVLALAMAGDEDETGCGFCWWGDGGGAKKKPV